MENELTRRILRAVPLLSSNPNPNPSPSPALAGILPLTLALALTLSLTKVPLLSHLTEAERDGVITQFREVKYAPTEFIIRQVQL